MLGQLLALEAVSETESFVRQINNVTGFVLPGLTKVLSTG